MIVSELIERLQALPQGARVVKSHSEGCSECNPEALPYYSEVYWPEFKAEGEYPNTKEKYLVVL